MVSSTSKPVSSRKRREPHVIGTKREQHPQSSVRFNPLDKARIHRAAEAMGLISESPFIRMAVLKELKRIEAEYELGPMVAEAESPVSPENEIECQSHDSR
jgi:hypothetical protein